jgi:hypothetical protein
MVTRQAAGVLRSVTLSATEGALQPSLILSSVREALADPNWRRAMEEKYEALLANQTLDLVPHRLVEMWSLSSGSGHIRVRRMVLWSPVGFSGVAVSGLVLIMMRP